MDQMERIFNALNYIEECLPHTAALKDVADRACMSSFHFHRIFSAITGESVGKYCQKRRLSMAVESLKNSDRSILEISLEHGYESQASFSRAFKDFFQITPGEARKILKPFPFSTPIRCVFPNYFTERKV